MTSRAQKMEQYLDELALIVDGDRDAIARHADFLADDDEARDLRHEASGVVSKIAAAGADYVPPADLEAKLLAALDARGGASHKESDASFSSGRKTDPGFALDPVRAAETRPLTSPSAPSTPSREQFGSTVRANAFGDAGPTTSGEMPRTIPATNVMPAISAEEVERLANEAKPSDSLAKPSESLAKPSESPASASEEPAKDNVVSIESARERAASKSSESPSTRSNSRSSGAPSKMGRVIMLFGGFTALAAAAAAAVVAVGSMGSGSLGSMLGSAGTSGGTEEPVVANAEATTARVLEIVRAAGGDPGTGVSVRAAGGSFAEAQPDGVVPAGGTIRTDARTRVRLALSDGSELTLNHGTELSFDAEVPRRFRLGSGELLADVEHMENGPNASFTTPTGTVEVVGTKFDLTATDELASVRVTRGKVRVSNGAGTVEVDQGEEGVLRTSGAPVVSPAIDLARAVAWADLGGDSATAGIVPEEEVSIPGIGSLRARRPGEREDRERPLAVSSANVRIRISGNVARTEIEQVFQNDGAAELEGIYRFPLPADARIARLALDVNGELEEGAFVARNRARRIWTGVIRNATPVSERRPTEDFIWVPGPWRDPALLEWQRGGNFELRIYPIPAQGSRRVVLAYTQVVRPQGSERRYVYPLPVSRDGSTRIGELNVDVRINGAQAVRTSGYAVTQSADTSATTLSYQARDFVPNGDLVIDYALPGGEGELAYWAYQGDAAAAPPERSRDRDREVVDAQRQIAADARGYVTFALRPRLPARTEGRTHDYVIVVDSSQSMVGERFTRASRLVTGLLAEMDRRDRFTVLACDYECRSMDGGAAVNASTAGNVRMHSPTSDEVRAAGEWLGQVEPAGASDLGASLRLAARAANQGTTDASREVHVIYVGDGVASVGHRAAGALAEEAEQIATRERVSITTVGIGGDADTVALGAIARAGGGHYVPFVPGERTSSTALAVLETTYGVSLEDATFELPEGLSDVAPTALPTIRAGEEVIVSARLDRPSDSGDEIVLGTGGGEAFEQRYPVTVEPSTSAGNLFVPAQWASSTIERLELEGRGEDEARIIALSKAYSVMSRHTSLLVLESESMFRAFGIDREAQQQAAWTGDEAAEGSISLGELGVESETDLLQGAVASAGEAESAGATGTLGGLAGHGRGGGGTGSGYGAGASLGGLRARRSAAPMDGDMAGLDDSIARADRAAEAPLAEPREASRQQVARRPATTTAAPAAPMAGGAAMPTVPMQPRGPGQWMRRVWVRVGDVSSSNEITFREQEAARVAEQNLAALPDSRDRHRIAVRALARAGNVSRALEVADAWIARDRMDPEALAARADLLARSGRRDEALRVLTGIVDLRPDDAVLQERLANAFDRAGQSERSCSHRVAMAEIDTTNADRVGAAVRCERATGRSSMADVLLRSVREERTRERAARVAGEAATPLPSRGDLFLDASWSGGDDVDLTLIAPDGSRISWMGGRTNVVATAPTASGTETLGLRSATAGNYLIEVSRTSATDRRPITGSIRVRVLDATETIRFTLRGDREVVGRAIVRREQRMESVGGGGW
jgi:tetratricopeptide (TPR) repeat protein